MIRYLKNDVLVMSRGIRYYENKLDGLIPIFMYYVVAAVLFSYALWLNFVPYVTVDDENITLKRTPFKTYSVKISELKKVDLLDDEVKLTHAFVTSIKFNELLGRQKDDVFNVLKGLINETSIH